MQAVILVGGEGTRLRPLTAMVPKPVVSLVDRPMMIYMLEWLRGHGIDDVIMSCGFKATKVREVLGDGSQLGIRLRFLEEPDPRGTAGALKFAEELLDHRFLMLNGDVLTDIDLTTQIAQHERTGATGTLALVPVLDPSSYGLVSLAGDGAVEQFLEKPAADTVRQTNLISAGAYVLERSVLELIAPGRNVSIEREVWPLLVDHGLYGYVDDDAYWIDVGTPERYLRASLDILDGQRDEAIEADALLPPDLLIDPTAVVEHSILGPGCRILEGARVTDSVLLGGVAVGVGATVDGSIAGPAAVIGDGAVVEGLTVLGDGAHVDAGAR